jgi:hypothetical protein
LDLRLSSEISSLTQRLDLRNENEIASRERASKVVEFNRAIVCHSNHSITVVSRNMKIGNTLNTEAYESELVFSLVRIADDVLIKPSGKAEDIAVTRVFKLTVVR